MSLDPEVSGRRVQYRWAHSTIRRPAALEVETKFWGLLSSVCATTM